MANDTPDTAPAGSPTKPSGPSNRWWRAGSDTNKIISEHTVIPSWQVASIKVAFSMA